MRMNEAAPLLVKHLEDPATPTEELEGIVIALKDLGARSAGASIASFLRLYHAEPADSGMLRALEASADALAALKPTGAEATLTAVATDAFTAPSVQARARAAITALSAPPPSATTTGAPTPTGPRAETPSNDRGSATRGASPAESPATAPR